MHIGTDGTAERPGRMLPYYVLAVLLLAYIVSFMDRTALAVLVQPIQRDLAIGDTSMGLLLGLGFVLLYSTVGLVAGRLADRADRRLLIVCGMIVWMLATSVGGFATGFGMLLLARILVGLGESALSPASYSLIASYFPRERLGLAAGIYSLGLTVGVGAGTAAVSAIAAMARHVDLSWLPASTDGWRATFLLVGLAGLPVVLLMLTVRDPRRRGEPDVAAGPTLRETFRYMAGARRAFGGIILGYALMATVPAGAIFWAPTWLIRLHGFVPATAGPALGLILAIGGSAGTIGGGWIADRLYRRGCVDAAPRVVIVSLLLEAPLFAIAYLSASTKVALAAYAAAIVALTLQGGLQGATMQLLAPSRMRGLAMAMFLMAANIIGLGLGPLAYAAMTEHVFGRPTAIGLSLALISVVAALLSALIVWRTLPAAREQMRAMHLAEGRG